MVDAIERLGKFMRRFTSDEALKKRVIDLIRPYYQPGLNGGPAYAIGGEQFVRDGHNLSQCFALMGLRGERFTFIQAASFQMPIWLYAEDALEISGVFGKKINEGAVSFASRFSTIGLDLDYDKRDSLTALTTEHYPERKLPLDHAQGRIRMAYALVAAVVKADIRTIDKLEPMARLLKDAVPVFEMGGRNSGRWLLIHG